MTKQDFIEKHDLTCINKGNSTCTELYINKKKKYELELYGWVKFSIDDYNTGYWDPEHYGRLDEYVQNYEESLK